MDEAEFTRRAERICEHLKDRLEVILGEEEGRAERDGEEQTVWLISALNSFVEMTAIRSWVFVLDLLKLRPDSPGSEEIFDRIFSGMLSFSQTQIDQELKSSGKKIDLPYSGWQSKKTGRG